ncbi:MAG: type II toxin-antitoxin system ParD family antitoxin [Cellvibrio sp.]
MPRNTSVTLGEHFDIFVAEQIQKGRFQSVSEVVRAGLRLVEEDEIKLEQLRAQLHQAKMSPIVEGLNEEKFLAEMHVKHLK